ncbi:Non-specific serine/threonine protein kinase [Mycena sanguinolenta]|uniref:Non-specific serine/threonine protein kinase n=1 Tax=Mycena sanguinolenta TaxID=230812 RepID=A0A8H6X8R1_9AGAR|nr:Non-specific serine/threonine protein kinase [Mycena sanguinolenta]
MQPTPKWPSLRVPNKSPTPPTLSTARSNTFSKGQIHVQLVQARNLHVSSIVARPYVSVQFEQNEFISRDPTDANDMEIHSTPAAVPTSRAMSVLSAIGSKAAIAEDIRRGTNKTSNLFPASSIPSASVLSTVGGLLDPISPHNPIWKDKVSFDVFSEASLITFNIYDRADVDQSFLGTLQIKPMLVHDKTIDQWYKLQPCENEVVSGELRVQVTFEEYEKKRAPSPRDFEFLKLIHECTSGKVFQVLKKDTKGICAMKVLSKKEIVTEKERIEKILDERTILQHSSESPFLVGFKFSFQTVTDLFLVTDFKFGGELFWHLQREMRFSVERAIFYVAEIILALEYLHKYDVVYCDLKPEKIMLDATGHIALCCCYCLSKADLRFDKLSPTFYGTAEYLAPEILDELRYSKVADFWSLGVLFFEMCCGWSPFYADDTQQMYENIRFGKIRFPKDVISEDGKQFVKRLLARNPKHRLGAVRDAEELKEHPFFSSIDWEALAQKQVMPPFKPVIESDELTVNFDEFGLVDLHLDDRASSRPEGCINIRIPKYSVRKQVMPPADSFDEFRLVDLDLGDLAASPPIDIRIPKHRLDAVRDSGEFKEHPLRLREHPLKESRPSFSPVDWEMLVRKQVTPPLKPVESDEQTTDFDEIFTSVMPVVESDELAINLDKIGLADLNDEDGPSFSQPEGYIDSLLASWERRRALLSISVSEASRQGISSDEVRRGLGDVEAQISTLLIHILSSQEAKRAAQRLGHDRAQCFVDAIQDALDRGTLPDSSSRSKARKLIQNVSEAVEQLPSTLFITGVNDSDEHPMFGGGFSDVYQASYQGKTVALKRLRTFTADSTSHRTRLQFYKEALVWQGLRHRFILPLLGIDRVTFAPAYCMVSPWMKYGTVLKYLRDHECGDVNRLLLEIAQGLDYLHSMKIVHGDLRGTNILISDDRNACLSDFGLATTIDVADSTIGVTTASNRAGSIRWFAPELIDPTKFGCPKFIRTEASDVYAYACVCLELYTRNPPFPHLQDVAAMLRVIEGERPEQPPTIPAAVWQLVTSAWAEDFRARPTIHDIAIALEGIPY